MNLTRRKLLQYGLGCSFGLLAGGAELNLFPNRHHLVLVNLKGGNDGFNTLVPYADSKYYQARPTLAVPAEAVLKLDQSVGLHPNLKGLYEIYQEKKLAIITSVGYPEASRSHSRAAQILTDFLPASWGAQKTELYAGDFAANLSRVAQKLSSKEAALVHKIDLSGFDTHRDQKQRHEALLSELDSGLTSFFGEIKQIDQEVLLLVFSEFGRSFAENDHGGTDHGTVQPLFVLGRRVAGGIWNGGSVTDLRSVYATIDEDFLASNKNHQFQKIDFIV
ncbi:MAG: DUF1501 domain-containing protein [Candidatus Obscuribacterales bacterium]|nr:DUF1501 domain-containing protein [Candidatus Obscuribacterales bacterium]